MCLYEAGDSIQFYSIDKDTYQQIEQEQTQDDFNIEKWVKFDYEPLSWMVLNNPGFNILMLIIKLHPLFNIKIILCLFLFNLLISVFIN